jgi:hypothetical protein
LSFFKDKSKVPKSGWKAHSIATNAILENYDGIISALHQLHIDTT